MNILGAGLAGLIAGNMFQRAQIFERSGADSVQHKAVLRFRSSAVGDAVGIEFRKVRVHKGLWSAGRDAQPSIQLANLYSQKVVGRLADRSIWNLDAVDRYIAPENFIKQLIERCESRITWNCPIESLDQIPKGTIISTVPMPVMAKMVGLEEAPAFNWEPIQVRRWRIPNADVFQTVYFPDMDTTLYRASITGNLLIAEYMHELHEAYDEQLFEAFGLHTSNGIGIDSTKQRYGKIARLDDEHWRRWFIFTLTHQHGVFSLGRFATWRNILLDDVLKDVAVIKRLSNMAEYGVFRQAVL
jgi:hypothetical protein